LASTKFRLKGVEILFFVARKILSLLPLISTKAPGWSLNALIFAKALSQESVKNN